MIKREFHANGCPCSICRELQYAGRRSFGLLAPIEKAWNAWRWLFYVGRKGIHYCRFSGFWQRQPAWVKAERGPR